MARARLTDILIAWGRLDAEKVASAVIAHKRWRKRIGRALVELGFCSRAEVVNALAAQAGLKAVDLEQVTPAHAAVAKVPARIARRHGVLPLRLDGTGTSLAVAVPAPVDAEALEAVRAVSGLKVVPFIADEEALEEAIDRAYAGDAASSGIDFRWDNRSSQDLELVTLPLAACVDGF